MRINKKYIWWYDYNIDISFYGLREKYIYYSYQKNTNIQELRFPIKQLFIIPFSYYKNNHTYFICG